MSFKDPEKQRKAHRKANQRHYLNNSAQYAQRTRDKRNEFRKRIDDLKTNKPCADCGVIYPPYVLDFDHRPGSGKISNVSRLASFGSTAALLAEIAKCDLVCANCHRERTHARQVGSPRPKSGQLKSANVQYELFPWKGTEVG